MGSPSVYTPHAKTWTGKDASNCNSRDGKANTYKSCNKEFDMYVLPLHFLLEASYDKRPRSQYNLLDKDTAKGKQQYISKVKVKKKGRSDRYQKLYAYLAPAYLAQKNAHEVTWSLPEQRQSLVSQLPFLFSISFIESKTQNRFLRIHYFLIYDSSQFNGNS